jgi:hypothetical protein
MKEKEKKLTNGPNDTSGIVWACFVVAVIPEPSIPRRSS